LAEAPTQKQLREQTQTEARARFTLIGRSYCHLCDEMRDALVGAMSAAGLPASGLTEVDLDAHPAWEERYGMLVPVLLQGSPDDGTEICHYHWDDAAWQAATRMG
jgi:hypothetical protein